MELRAAEQALRHVQHRGISLAANSGSSRRRLRRPAVGFVMCVREKSRPHTIKLLKSDERSGSKG